MRNNPSPPLFKHNDLFSLEVNWSCDPVRHVRWCVSVKKKKCFKFFSVFERFFQVSPFLLINWLIRSLMLVFTHGRDQNCSSFPLQVVVIMSDNFHYLFHIPYFTSTSPSPPKLLTPSICPQGEARCNNTDGKERKTARRCTEVFLDLTPSQLLWKQSICNAVDFTEC